MNTPFEFTVGNNIFHILDHHLEYCTTRRFEACGSRSPRLLERPYQARDNIQRSNACKYKLHKDFKYSFLQKHGSDLASSAANFLYQTFEVGSED